MSAGKNTVKVVPKGGGKTPVHQPAAVAKAGGSDGSDEETGEPGRAEAVRKILTRLEAKMKKGEMKVTMGDYIRLVQLLKELGDESPKEIKVTWVEPAGGAVEETESGKEG